MTSLTKESLQVFLPSGRLRSKEITSLGLDGHFTHWHRLEPYCFHLSVYWSYVWEMGGRINSGAGKKRTAINRLRSLLLESASVILSRSLGRQASRRAVLVEIAALVHGLLEGVTLPAEDVVTVGGSATVFTLSASLSLHIKSKPLRE